MFFLMWVDAARHKVRNGDRFFRVSAVCIRAPEPICIFGRVPAGIDWIA